MGLSEAQKMIGSAIIGLALLMMPLASIAQSSSSLYRCQSSTQCTGPAHVIFNHYVNYPVAGNERYFYDAKDSAITSRGGFYDVLPVRDSEVVLMRIYVHNDADTVHHRNLTVDQSIARNVRVMASLPNGAVTSYSSQAVIAADNAVPQAVRDTVTLQAGQAFTVEYVPGSTQFYSVNQAGQTLGDNIAGSGISLGDIRPGGQNLGYVTYRVRIHMVGPNGQNLVAGAQTSATTVPSPTYPYISPTQQTPGSTTSQSSSSTVAVNGQTTTVTMDSSGGIQTTTINGGNGGVSVDVRSTQSQSVSSGPAQTVPAPTYTQPTTYTPPTTYPSTTYNTPSTYTQPTTYTPPAPATTYVPPAAPAATSQPTEIIEPAATTEPTTLPQTGPVSAGAGALGGMAMGYALLLYQRGRQRLRRALLGLGDTA